MWLRRTADSDIVRIKENIKRLEDLRSRIHHLSFFVLANQSGGHRILNDLLEKSIVAGRPHIREKLSEALLGENNQKVILDSPLRAKALLHEAEDMVVREISKEERRLRELLSG